MNNSEYNFICDKCLRTFKLEEFFHKHKKVHELKKQHKCDICGFVYGTPKGLDGHIKTHTDEKIAQLTYRQKISGASGFDAEVHISPKKEGVDFTALEQLNGKALSTEEVSCRKGNGKLLHLKP